jgi:integrase
MGKLTALKVERAKKAGMYGDGDGLYLQVSGPDARSWIFRYQENGKQHYLGLGSAKDIGLADARELAAEARLLRRKEKKDPIEERRRQRNAARIDAARSMTFDECAEGYIKAHEPSWRNPKHRQQWKNTLATYVSPKFGSVPVPDVDTAMVMKALEPIWTKKPETAGRVRGRIEAVLDWAKARGFRNGENPARWRGHLSNLLAAKSKVHKVRHHPALPYTEIGTFIADLRTREGSAAAALEFLILTVARTEEVVGACRSEIDFATRIWKVPSERMKADRDHRVPLSRAAMKALERVKGDGRFLFPGLKAGEPLSNAAMDAVLDRMGYKSRPATVHGFRSTFRDWAAERTNFPRELAEAALAHALEDKTEAAYQRGDLLEKRRRLMEAWAAFCGKPAVSAQVVPLRAS